VLHRLKKPKVTAHEPPLPVVYLSWQDGAMGDGPHIRLRLPRDVRSSLPSVAVAAELHETLARHFDAQGGLRAALPDAWAALEHDLGGRTDVHLGEDARAHAMRVAFDRAHAARRASIREEIGRTGGHLPGVRTRLYPYQTEGVAFLASTGRAVLADDMGLGKTLQAIAAARWLVDHEGVRRVLIVCPASLKTQWQREILRFTGLAAVIIEGGAAPRMA